MSNLDYTKTGFCTAAVHAGYIRDKEWGAEATPIYQTSTYTFETLEEGGGVRVAELNERKYRELLWRRRFQRHRSQVSVCKNR